MLWNIKFLCICHQVMRVDPLKPKILVYLSSPRDDGVPLGNQKCWCTCHYATRVDVVEQNVLVDLSSRDDGVRLGNKILVHLSSHDKGGCCGTKNTCGPVIT
jgi:hypothetical protein